MGNHMGPVITTMHPMLRVHQPLFKSSMEMVLQLVLPLGPIRAVVMPSAIRMKIYWDRALDREIVMGFHHIRSIFNRVQVI